MEGLINVQIDIKNSITKALTNLKKTPKDRISVEYLETRLENLERDWANFRNNNSKIHEKYQPDVIKTSTYVTSDVYDETEDTYVTCKSQIKSMLNKLSSSIKKACIDESESDKSAHLNTFLPKISIPTYSGKYSEWNTFRDLFISLVHKNSSLDNVQKLHYLKSHLTGEAEQLIRHTPITDANYTRCWEQLEKRYNNKKYLADCILKRLFGQRRMTVESSTSLKDLLDTTTDCLSALKNLDVDVSTWDIMIIHIVTNKLDAETRKQWELSVCSNDCNNLPTFEQFKTFLGNRFRALESIEPKRSSTFQPTSSHGHNTKTMLVTNSFNRRCEYCSEEHKLCFCKKFIKLATKDRRDFVIKNKICYNCLGSNHSVYNCKKFSTCKICQKRHHSLLHMNEPEKETNKELVHTSISKPSTSNSGSSSNSSAPIVSCLSTGVTVKPKQVLLATALIKATSRSGDGQFVRALLDQGSQSCFITEATVQFLRLQKIPVQGTITGLGGDRSTKVNYMVQLSIQSRVETDFNLELNAYVLSNITSYLPERSISPTNFDWVLAEGLCLADPQFNVPNKIDILLGAEVYSSIMKEGMSKSPSGTLIAQNTTLGWILSGVVQPVKKESSQINRNINVLHTQFKEDEMLKKFWEIEELSTSTKKMLTPEEQKCEDFYKSTTKRTKEGRYEVRLPFREENPSCKAGNSRAIAVSRLKSLEKRLSKDQELKQEYSKVINEYLHLGHMRAVDEDDEKKDEAVYLPHHAVVNNKKTTTRVRVVFNASEKNNRGISLNDTLMIGPTIQADLRHTVLRWRVHQIGLVADIVKMYRQVRIAEEDVSFQRIVWRDDPEKEIKDYELLTVTFGTASAPFLAVRTLHQLAYDEGGNYPKATDKILNCFYMDDLMTGCSSVEEGVQLHQELTEVMERAGFLLQKWNSNNGELVRKICKDKAIGQKGKEEYNADQEKNTGQQMEKEVEIKQDSTIKILGLTWDCNEDSFQYSVNLAPMNTASVTKRTIISDIAKLYDPLGWAAPCIILAKITIQKLWLAGIGWDEEASAELINEWSTYRAELSALTNIRLPRWMGTSSNDDIELHGFCDASKAAYSAVVYLRVFGAKGIHVALVVAKTRVAPIKQVSIPRLELCGAVLLAKLLSETAEVLNITQDKIRAWTDSTIVLAWLNSHPSKWKTFVGNRVSEILSTLSSSQWFHVSTKENPADCASRGVLPSMLADNSLWYSGPPFLKEKTINYKRPKDLDTNLEESVKVHLSTVEKVENDTIERFSTLKRLIQITAYCRRVLKKGQIRSEYLQKKERDEALQGCIRQTQKEHFLSEYLQIQNDGCIKSRSSKLKSLCPYLDDNGIMRVRGRLHKAQLDPQTKHPIILSSSAHLTKLIVADAHLKTLHGGFQLTLNYVRSAYWIIGARNAVKHCILKCVVCAKQRASVKTPMMGSLPTVRCTPSRPFLHSGVDYAGPIQLRTTKGRGHRSYKGYICLFVCMATRAVHLEVVSDMTSQAFLAAFKRFVARRGHCAQLWSDNGTTFVGASKELQPVIEIQKSAAAYLESCSTEWHFIPPHAPNFGGLWEAGVKSTKFHLKRIIGDSTLTYEEMSTLLSQVEACLNSRPISVINSTDPNELLPLTPAHFLVGEPLVSLPETDYCSSNISHFTRWQLVQRMLQSFWKRWSQEYLVTLLRRYKWTTHVPEPKIGDIVLVKEDDLPPSRWLLGRVVEKHPGDDDVTRVVTLRTKASTIKRPVSKICILPIAE